MWGWSVKKMLFILAFLVTVFLVLNFQNCSKAQQFAPTEIKADNSTSEVEIEKSATAELIVPPVDNTPKPIEFVFIIDASYSNASYAQTITNSLKNFISLLPETALEISIYFLGEPKGIIERKTTQEAISATRKKNTSITIVNPSVFSVARAEGASQDSFRASLETVFNQVSQRLANVSNGGTDTTPQIKQELLALMDLRKGLGTKYRTVYVVISDEDISGGNQATRPFLKQAFESISVQQSTGGMFSIPVLTKATEEGTGNTIWVAGTFKGCPTCYPKVDSCSDTTGIQKAIADTMGNWMISPTTYSGCKYEPVDSVIAWQTDNSTQEFTDYSGNTYKGTTAYSQVLDIEKQFQSVSSRPNQPQFFIGLFSIMKSADLKVPDQEISVNFQKFITAITPNENRYFQSIADSEYNSFLNKVNSFKSKTENNRFSLTPLVSKVPLGRSIKVTSVSVFDFQTQQYLPTDKFVQAGEEIVIQDLRFDFQAGGKISIEYSFLE